MAVDVSAPELVQTKPTQSETVKAWQGQGGDARHYADNVIIEGTREVTKPVQPPPETSRMQDAQIDSSVTEDAYNTARNLGNQAAGQADLDAAKAREDGIIAGLRLKIASMIGRKN